MNRHLIKARELIGNKFNRLVIVLILDERSSDGHIMAKCLCDCGSEPIVRLSFVKNNKTMSCGCLNKELSVPNLKKAQAIQFSREPKLGSAQKVYRDRYADGDLSFEEFFNCSQQKCWYCGCDPHTVYNSYLYKGAKFSIERIRDGYFTYNGLDRIDSSLGHTKNNTVTCCSTCNKAKLNQSLQEFLEWIKKVYNFQLVKENDFNRQQSARNESALSSQS